MDQDKVCDLEKDCGRHKEHATNPYEGSLLSEEGPAYKTPSNDDDEHFVNAHVETTSHPLHKTQWKKQTTHGGK